MKSRYDVVILGAGHNGLVTATYLGRAGLSVLLLEKNDYIGGATTSQKVFRDYDARLSRFVSRQFVPGENYSRSRAQSRSARTRNRIEDYLEDQLDVSEEFTAKIDNGKRDITEGRVRICLV
jgi:phytoene dehydrogenase-like protein